MHTQPSHPTVGGPGSVKPRFENNDNNKNNNDNNSNNNNNNNKIHRVAREKTTLAATATPVGV